MTTKKTNLTFLEVCNAYALQETFLLAIIAEKLLLPTEDVSRVEKMVFPSTHVREVFGAKEKSTQYVPLSQKLSINKSIFSTLGYTSIEEASLRIEANAHLIPLDEKTFQLSWQKIEGEIRILYLQVMLIREMEERKRLIPGQVAAFFYKESVEEIKEKPTSFTILFRQSREWVSVADILTFLQKMKKDDKNTQVQIDINLAAKLFGFPTETFVSKVEANHMQGLEVGRGDGKTYIYIEHLIKYLQKVMEGEQEIPSCLPPPPGIDWPIMMTNLLVWGVVIGEIGCRYFREDKLGLIKLTVQYIKSLM